MANFFLDNWLVISFYLGIILLLYIFRSKFDWEGGAGLLRRNWGVKWMQSFGTRHAKIIRVLGYIGIYVGFAGMLLILFFIGLGVYQLFANPNAPPVISPVLPGVQVPGSPIAFPLFETLIALFFVIVVHEAAHGIVAAAHKIKIKSSGLLVFGPIFGAFVEPNETSVKKKKDKVQQSIFAAGPFSNVLMFFVVLGLFIGLASAMGSVLDPQGITVQNVVENSPGEHAGLIDGQTYTLIDGDQLLGVSDLTRVMSIKNPGDTLTLSTSDTTYQVTLGEHPDDNTKAWIGIEGINTYFANQATHPILFAILFFILETLRWTYVLSLGLGLANLLPLGPVDGGRMWQLVSRKWFGKEKGDVIWAKSSMTLFVIIIILLVVPIIRAVLF